MSEVVTTEIKPLSQAYLSCDTQGNCCDLETNICQNINTQAVMSSSGGGSGINFTSLLNQVGNWVMANKMEAGIAFLGIILLTGSRGRR